MRGIGSEGKAVNTPAFLRLHYAMKEQRLESELGSNLDFAPNFQWS